MPPALLALTPGLAPEDAPARLLGAVEAAWSAGLRGVVLREPRLSDRAWLALARALRDLLDPAAGGWLCAHDRAHLAAGCGADAVHLGFRSLPAAEVRPWLAPDLALGVSTHAGDPPEAWEHADYALHGPLRAMGKPHARPPVGLEGLRLAAAAAPVPLWALGGVLPEDAAGVRASGARGVAVLSRLLGATSPAAATRAYLAAWED